MHFSRKCKNAPSHDSRAVSFSVYQHRSVTENMFPETQKPEIMVPGARAPAPDYKHFRH